MKKAALPILTALFLSTVCHTIAARDKDTTYWHKTGIAGITMTQVSLSNWAAGGDGSVAFDLMFNYAADYKKEKHLWQNKIELGYGLNKTKSDGTRKTNDKIYLSSNYGYAIAKNWYISGFLTFESQFAKGYDYSVSKDDFISKFMSPGYLSVGPGIKWTPKKWFTATMSPATWRGTFVLDNTLSDMGAFGVDPGEHLFSEFGGMLNAEVNYEFLPNMTLISRLNLFSNYLEEPKNVDVKLDIMVNMKINKWFSANFMFNMIYDNNTKITDKHGNTGPRLQLRESLGVGLQAHF